MKIVSILGAQAFQIYRPFGTFGYLPDAVQKTVDEFKFADFPKTVTELFPTDATKGITFRHGKLVAVMRTVVLDWLQVFPAGLQVMTQTHTNDALFAVEYISEWAKREFHLELETVKEPGFWSQLNVRFEKPLTELIPQFQPVAKDISAKHADFLTFRPDFELTALHFGYEPKANLNPVLFRIERAPNIGFWENIYTSDAPLSTDSHVEALQKFEAICLDKTIGGVS